MEPRDFIKKVSIYSNLKNSYSTQKVARRRKCNLETMITDLFDM